jgi:hypothetical protein
MQRVLGRLAAQFLGDDSVGKSDVTLPASSAQAAAPSTPSQSGHQLLGEQRVQDFLVITFCAAVSLIGWLMIVQGVDQVRTIRAVLAWPTAEGVIQSAEVFPVEGSQGARWRPHVSYAYAVGGRVVSSTRMSLGKARVEADQSDAERYVAQYRPGTTVTVFFNPRELTESVLDVSTPPSVYLNLAFGVSLAVGGPLLLVLFGFWPRTQAAAAAARAA